MNDRLFIDNILDYCDVPQLMLARDKFETTYLCLLYDDEPICRYTAIRLSNTRLRSFMKGEVDLRELFIHPENPSEYFDVEFSNDVYTFCSSEEKVLSERKLPGEGYKLSGSGQETVVVHIPSSDRYLLRDLIQKFGWACVF